MQKNLMNVTSFIFYRVTAFTLKCNLHMVHKFNSELLYNYSVFKMMTKYANILICVPFNHQVIKTLITCNVNKA